MSILDESFQILNFFVKDTETEFRLWGHLQTVQGANAAFWSLSGQKHKLDFKNHGMYSRDLLNAHGKRHEKKGFTKVSLESLREIWPNFDIVFEQEYTSFVLQESVQL
jgi:hypothetical protein